MSGAALTLDDGSELTTDYGAVLTLDMPPSVPASLPTRSVDDFTSLLTGLAPTGDAWPTEPDSVQQQAYAALALTFARLEARGNALVVDAFPATTFKLLPEWERSLGLPDPCIGPEPTLQQRRASVMARLTARGGQSIPYFVAFAAALGFTVTVEEMAPARLGFFRLGQRMRSARWAHVWRVITPATVITSFRLGRSQLGERFRSWGFGILECELNRIKPAHTILLFAYVGATSANPLGGFVLGRDILGGS